MRNKIVLFILIVIVLVLGLTACSKVDFDDLTIIAESVENVEDGEYTLDYSIKDLEKFEKQYKLSLSVKVFDDNYRAIEVENNRTFIAETDNVYYVTVYVKAMINGRQETKSKSFTITTVKTDPKLILKLIVLDNVLDHRVINLTYGQTYNIGDLPEIPDANPVEEGYIYSIDDKYWVIRNSLGEETPLTQEHLNNITKTLTIYAHYDFRKLPAICTLTFDSKGGTEVTSITQPFNSSVTRPVDPTRTGYYFLGWYNDPEYKSAFSWINPTMPSTRTLYAKWLEDNSPTPHSYFEFVLKSDNQYGYEYYEISVNSYPDIVLPADLVIPNGYDNKPVKVIDENGFSGHTEIQTVIIPDTIIALRPGAFSGCASLIEVNLPNTIDTLHPNTFENCSSLTSISIPDSVREIKDEAFAGCESLASVSFTKMSSLVGLTANTFISTAITQLTLPHRMRNRTPNMKNRFNNTIAVDYFEEPPEEEEEE